MKVQTKIFGEIEIGDDKIITFPGGIIGFPEMTKFTLMRRKNRPPFTGCSLWTSRPLPCRSSIR